MILSLNKIFYLIKDIFNILIKNIFINYFKFSGRTSRKEYLIYCISYLIIDYFLQRKLPFLWYFIYIIYIFIPSLSIAFRRLHDFNFSGIVILCAIIFVIAVTMFFDNYDIKFINDRLTTYFIYTLFISLDVVPGLIPGNSGSNKYGEPPE
ncbi:DUF805 domain-containing protein (plasmid) [Candidatus Trichorickettsia mobilis]|uniref:DUF805 domain-containing protein n=1 Tax=Candidatus Trichorickettsia mobilis TaxID=1346319 RepID=UPI002B258C2E|nr:DUF805 domain-containing protein [Candidatus Trichorickettsia mobilis]WPY01769.1 DUF805 domain-containing protein [Candidatus Trichorickettsia mobilis]